MEVDTKRAKFDTLRTQLIAPFLEAKYNKRAIALELAERYRDFNALIRVCVESEDKARLMHYTTQFDHFAEHLFEWYLRESTH